MNSPSLKTWRRAAWAVALALFGAAPAASQSPVPGRTIELPGISGRIDHMDIDLEGDRLFVAALAAGSLEVIDLFFDAERRQLYAVCGQGVVDVVRVREGDRLETGERLQTAPGARTGLFVPRLSTLFVAVPARDGAAAQIRAYPIR